MIQHEGLDINQHASDECTIPSELPKTLECLANRRRPFSGCSTRSILGCSTSSFSGCSTRSFSGCSTRSFSGCSTSSFSGCSTRSFSGCSTSSYSGCSIQDAIRQSRKLNDNEKYELLISIAEYLQGRLQ